MIAIILLAVNYLAVAALFLVKKRRGFNLLDPAWAFLVGYFITYCVRPTLFMIYPDDLMFYADYLSPQAVFSAGLPGAWLFALLGFLGFTIGDLCCDRFALRVARLLPETSLGQLARHHSYSAISILFLGAGMAGLWGFIRQAGWSGSLLQLMTGFQRGAFLEEIYGHGYYTLAMQLSMIGWALMCAKWIAYPKIRHGWRRAAHAVWRVVCMMGSLLIWVAFGERSSILLVIFIPFALYVSMKPAQTGAVRERPLLRWTPALVVLFVVVAGPLGLLMKQQIVTVPGAANMATSAWDSMEFTVAANDHFPVRNLFWGQSYMGDVFYTWFPRAIFPKKPWRYGIVSVQDVLAPGLTDFSGTFPTGILVEAYANFWYIGLFFVPLLWGIICRAVYFKLQADSFFWSVQTVLLLQQLTSFRGIGSVLAMLEANLFVVGFVIVACRLARFFTVSSKSLPHGQQQQLGLSS